MGGQLVNFQNKKVKKFREIYLLGETDKDIKKISCFEKNNILNARKYLIKHVELQDYKEKIDSILSFLLSQKKQNTESNVIYIIYTKALDALLIYNDSNDLKKLKELFIRFTNLFYAKCLDNKFMLSDENVYITKKSEDNIIKILAFDLQSLIIHIVEEN